MASSRLKIKLVNSPQQFGICSLVAVMHRFLDLLALSSLTVSISILKVDRLLDTEPLPTDFASCMTPMPAKRTILAQRLSVPSQTRTSDQLAATMDTHSVPLGSILSSSR